MDNASVNEKALRELETLLHKKGISFDTKQSRVMCISHVIHIATSHFLDKFFPCKARRNRSRAAAKSSLNDDDSDLEAETKDDVESSSEDEDEPEYHEVEVDDNSDDGEEENDGNQNSDDNDNHDNGDSDSSDPFASSSDEGSSPADFVPGKHRSNGKGKANFGGQTYAQAVTVNPVAKLRKLIKAMRSSGTRRASFRDHIARGLKNRWFKDPEDGDIIEEFPGFELLRDVPTRWDSTYTMINRAWHLRPVRVVITNQ